MNRILISLLFLFGFTVPAAPQCYELIWSEESDPAGLPDPAVWKLETGAGGLHAGNYLVVIRTTTGKRCIRRLIRLPA